MTQIVKAPGKFILNQHNISMFLAGSIDMGSAEDWQTRLSKDLQGNDNLVLFNPRRDDWDSSWVQDPTPGTQFHEQVTWELDHLQKADIVAIYFADGSQSPITLLEFGMFAQKYRSVVIYCTPEFYRYGNVKIVADRFDIPVCSTYEEFKDQLQKKVERKKHLTM